MNNVWTVRRKLWTVEYWERTEKVKGERGGETDGFFPNDSVMNSAELQKIK